MALLSCPDCGTPLAADAGGFCAACAFGECRQNGDRFGVPGHEVGEEIARGGAGIVYRARQLEPGREVALKMLLPLHAASREAIERFRLEAATVAALEHPAILPLYATGEADGLPWFTMKLAPGGSLAERATGLRGRWREIAGLMAGLADAVHFAHSRGVLHRDLKPSNVLFDEAGRAYVSDFGIAKSADSDLGLTRTLNVMGTPAYLAPEVAEAGAQQATTASDVYALGAMLHELLGGAPPFRGETLAVLLRQIANDPPAALPAEVPRDLALIAQKALEKEPAARIASAAELAAELRRWLDGRPVHSRPISPAERSLRWARRNPLVAALLLALVLGAAVSGAALWQGNRELRRALERAREAALAERSALQESLLAQARGIRRSGQLGQSLAALEVLRRAPDQQDLAWRAEAAAALALSDAAWRPRTMPVSLRSYRSNVSYTDDFRFYACAAPRTESAPGDAVVRDNETGNITLALPNPDAAACEHFRFSPDGEELGITHADGTTHVWALSMPGGPTRISKVPPDRAGRALPYAFVPGGDGGIVFISEAGRLLAREWGVLPVEIGPAPAGALWVTVAADSTTILIGTATDVHAVHPDPAACWSLPLACTGAEPAWNRAWDRLAISERIRSDIVVLEPGKRRIVRTLTGHSQSAGMLAFHPLEPMLASLSPDRTLRCWNLETGECVWQAAAAPRGLAWSRDGRHLAAFRTPLELGLLDVQRSAVFREFARAPRQADYYWGHSPGSAAQRFATADPTMVRLWDWTSNTVEERAFPEEGSRSVFLVGSADDWVTSSLRGSILRYRREAGPEARPEVLGRGFVLSAGPREMDWFVYLPETRRLILWPSGDATRARTLREGIEYWGVRPSPDGKRAALQVSAQPRLEIMDLASGAIQEFTAGAHLLPEWSPDSQLLITANTSEARIYRVADWSLVATWPIKLSGEPQARVAWSPDGTLVATQSGPAEMEIRSIADWRIRHRLEAPAMIGSLHDVVFSADGRHLHLFAGSHRAFVWDLQALELELERLRAPR